MEYTARVDAPAVWGWHGRMLVARAKTIRFHSLITEFDPEDFVVNGPDDPMRLCPTFQTITLEYDENSGDPVWRAP